jgi:hypothetical protein
VTYADFLHIYGQSSPHASVYIAGNKEALRSLRNLINAALEYHCSEFINYYANDGEEFAVYVVPVDEQQVGRLSSPYPMFVDGDQREDRVHPWQIAGKPIHVHRTNADRGLA